MKKIGFLFIALIAAVAHGSNTMLHLTQTFNGLSTPEKIILPVIPFVMPVAATVWHYLATDYEPKTVALLEEELDELENIKKGLVSLVEKKPEAESWTINVNDKAVKPIVDRCNTNATMRSLCDISDFKKHVEITMKNRATASGTMLHIYNRQIANSLFYDPSSLLSCINFCINKSGQRLNRANKPIPLQAIHRLKTVYTKNYPTTMAVLWIATLIGVALPLLYMRRKMKKTKIVDH